MNVGRGMKRIAVVCSAIFWLGAFGLAWAQALTAYHVNDWTIVSEEPSPASGTPVSAYTNAQLVTALNAVSNTKEIARRNKSIREAAWVAAASAAGQVFLWSGVMYLVVSLGVFTIVWVIRGFIAGPAAIPPSTD